MLIIIILILVHYNHTVLGREGSTIVPATTAATTATTTTITRSHIEIGTCPGRDVVIVIIVRSAAAGESRKRNHLMVASSRGWKKKEKKVLRRLRLIDADSPRQMAFPGNFPHRPTDTRACMCVHLTQYPSPSISVLLI